MKSTKIVGALRRRPQDSADASPVQDARPTAPGPFARFDCCAASGMENTLDLLESWHRLAGPYHCFNTREAFLRGIVKRYGAADRHYHNLEHVASIVELLDEFRGRLLEYEPLSFAAWFHDVIYKPGSSDNERLSAELARRVLGRLMTPGWFAPRVSALILATRDHIPPDPSFDAALFIDADLAILGSEPRRYDVYTAAIRREYAAIPEKRFRAGRRDHLEHLLRRPRIFHTSELRERLEETARGNILREMELMGTGD